MTHDAVLEKIAALDTVIHNPARLMILYLLSQAEVIDYTLLMRQTRLTSGNITTHLSKLAQAGYIDIQKSFVNNRPNTSISLTPRGFDAYNRWGMDVWSAVPSRSKQEIINQINVYINPRVRRYGPVRDWHWEIGIGPGFMMRESAFNPPLLPPVHEAYWQ